MRSGEVGGGIVDEPRSANTTDSEGVTDFCSQAPIERTRRECNTSKQGYQGTTSQIAQSQSSRALTRRVNFATVQTAKRDVLRSPGKEGNEATVD